MCEGPELDNCKDKILLILYQIIPLLIYIISMFQADNICMYAQTEQACDKCRFNFNTNQPILEIHVIQLEDVLRGWGLTKEKVQLFNLKTSITNNINITFRFK